jgi:hypothetical protein
MAMQIYTGTIKELGSGVEETSERIGSAQYSYIEFTDGRMLRNISVVGGLIGKLDAALEDDGPIELHVMEGGKRSDMLVAVKTSDGQTYATNLHGSTVPGYVMVAGWTVLGLVLLPVFGLGLLLLWVAWRTWHGLQLVGTAREHLRGLTSAIVV